MKNLNTQKSMELGELYRELRIARGLKLKDVVRDNLSLSQLSRFENGQTMLSADRMLLAISGIHMSFAEFGHALNNYKEAPYFAAGKKIMELYGKQDVEGLKGLLEEYKNYESREIYNRLNSFSIDIKRKIITEVQKPFQTSFDYFVLDNDYVCSECGYTKGAYYSRKVCQAELDTFITSVLDISY